MEEVKERSRELLLCRDQKAAMEMVDRIERIGLSHHFEEEIDVLLQRWFSEYRNPITEDLFTTALRFRLLRQNGFPIHSGN